MKRRSRSLIELLELRAESELGSRGFEFLVSGEVDGQRAALSYTRLCTRARAIGARLIDQGLTGQRLLLVFPPGLEFIEGFFGCLYAGAIATPVYPPDPSRLAQSAPRIQAILDDARPAAVLTTQAICAFAPVLDQILPDLGTIPWIAVDGIDDAASESWKTPAVASEDLAFLQYTSGSTGRPKGVMVSHANLLSNSLYIQETFDVSAEDSGVIWLPPYHDMGLIGGLIQPLYTGSDVTILSPLAFLQRPLRWLHALSEGSSVSGGPNFAYDLCARKATAEDLERLDLSNWRVAFNGAEPIRWDTLERFARVFEPCGFRFSSFLPCYGLAEGTLLTAGSRVPESRQPLRVDRKALSVGLAVDAPEDGLPSEVVTLPSSGCVTAPMSAVVVDPETRTPLPDRSVGEIWLAGPGVAQGYWKQPELTREMFAAFTSEGAGPYLRTGDLGFFLDQQLHITGRRKDLIILRGRNHYPQDIERSAESLAGVRPGCTAAFALDEGEAAVVVCAEVDTRVAVELPILASQLQAAVSTSQGVHVQQVVFLRARTLPKTSSGKIRRRETRAALVRGDLEILGRFGVLSDEVRADLPHLGSAGTASSILTQLRDHLQSPDTLLPAHTLGQLGLDSLAQAELLQQVELAFEVALPVALLSPSTRLEQLAHAIRAGVEGDAPAPLPRAEGSTHALAPIQGRLWFQERLSPGSPLYNLHISVRFEGPLDADAFVGALALLFERHDVLRTRFFEVDHLPTLQVLDAVPLPLEHHDLSSLVDPARNQALAQLGTEHGSTPFDLSVAPVARLALVRLGPAHHVLLWTLHHLVVDGWSLRLLLEDFLQSYRALSHGTEPALAPTGPRYADFALWQRHYLDSPAADHDRAFWKTHLADLGPPPLPVQPAAGDPWRGDQATFSVPAELSTALQALAHRQGTTLFRVLLATFALLLSRTTQSSRFSLATLSAGRPLASTHRIVGFFVNTLLLRCELDGAPSFSAWLARIGVEVDTVLCHQSLPFDEVVSLARSTSGPLFNSAFSFENTPRRDVEVPGLQISVDGHIDGSIPGTARFDLALVMAWEEGQLVGALQHRLGVLSPDTARLLQRRFCRLLRAVVDTPDAALADLELLPEDERRRILAFNPASVSFDPTCVHAVVAALALERPDAVAVTVGGSSLTRAQLDARTNHLAHALRTQGIGRGDLVGVCMQRSLDLLPTLLAVHRAGAATIPLDPAYPAARLTFILEDAQCALLVTDDPATAPAHAQTFDASAHLRAWNSADPGPPSDPPGPSDLAYVIYTSGSTGRPKGVRVEHRSLGNFLRSMQRRPGLSASDTLLAVTSLSFDISGLELFLPLITGARLVLASASDARNGQRLAELIERQAITVLQATPSTWRLLLTAGWSGAPLRALCGGEALPPALATDLAPRVRELWNLYGPTETTIWSCVHHVSADDLSSHRPLPIGRPIDNTTVYLLDEAREPVPLGTVGHLWIGGEGVARGYLQRPELNAERFCDDPWRPGQRIYCTGDLARCRPDGTVEFLGRLDHQIKLRGHRIELGEIEARLGAHPDVSACAVVADLDGPAPRLVAYATGPGPLSAADARAFLAETLPEPMLPAAFTWLGSLPQTPNGKIDRAALLALDVAPEPARTRPHVPPRTPLESRIALLWQQLLGHERVGVHDDFFVLGGHSLLATQMVSRLRDTGVSLSLQAVFDHPTVEALAGVAQPVSAPLPPITRASDIPVQQSSAQRRLWFLSQLDAAGSQYNISAQIDLRGPLDPERLRLALERVAERHEVLRTAFEVTDGRPQPVVCPPAPWSLPVIDLSESDLASVAQEHAAQAFDLSRGPLLRTQLVRLDPEHHVLLLSTHHIASDGWSLDLLRQELGAHYAGHSLPALPLQYTDYAAWEHTHLTPSLAPQLAYWTQQLQDLPTLDLPTDAVRPARAAGRGAAHAFSWNASQTRALRTLAADHQATLFMVLLTGMAAVLGRRAGCEDVAVGAPVARRDQPAIEPLLGVFVNTLVLRCDLGGSPSFARALAGVRRTTLQAFDHQALPFDQLVAALDLPRDLSRSPLFQVLLAVQEHRPPALELEGVVATVVHPENPPARFELTLAVDATPEGLDARWVYDADLFDADTLTQLTAELKHLLAGAVANPDAALTRLTDPDEDAVAALISLGAGDMAAPSEQGLNAAFFEHAAQQPQAVALSHAGQELTYAELASRVRAVVGGLAAADIAAGDFVGVCLERGPALVITTLAILAHGAVFVPLDPRYPAARLQFIAEDCGLRSVVTDAHCSEALASIEARVLKVDTLLASEPTSGVVSATDLAYVIYTSGSTGRPKGVLVGHGGLRNLATSHRQLFTEAELARVLQFASSSFDGFVYELCLAYFHGGALVLADAEILSTPRRLEALISSEQVTLAVLPPAMLTLISPSGPYPACVVSVGSRCPAGVAQRWAQGRRFFNGYGPTEGTVCTSMHLYDPGVNGPPPIGRPICNTRVYLLDTQARLAPRGATGELYLAGPGVAHGYHQRLELTAAHFLADPFVADARMYRTGDLARWRTDGTLEYRGRIDDQVNLRGQRVELGEVELALRALPGVEAAAVSLQEHPALGELLVAHVASELSSAAVRLALGDHLPPYMVPSFVVCMEVLPLTPNGKVDRAALPSPSHAPQGPGARTQTEAALARVWSSLLGVTSVGPDADFFALGGHSLLATQLVSRVRDRLGVELSLQTVFASPTLGAHAAKIDGLREGVHTTRPVIEPRADGLRAPLSHAQERLWLLDRLLASPEAYTIPLAVWFDGALDLDALETALRGLVARHEVLRTAVVEEDGVAWAVPGSAEAWSLSRRRVAGRATAIAQAHIEAQRPLVLASGELFRATVWEVGNAALLGMVLHHIAGDGVSMAGLLSELEAGYAKACGADVDIPAPRLQYADFASWERAQPPSRWAPALAYWEERLEGLETLVLPTKPRPASPRQRGRLSRFELDATSARALAASHEVTLFVVLLTALSAVLSRYSGQDDLAIGVPVSGRDRAELEPLIGLFVNTLVMRVDLSADPSAAEALTRTRTRVLEALAHQQLPFDRLVAELDPPRDLSRSPWVQVMLSVQEHAPQGLCLGGVAGEHVLLDLGTSRLDLTLTVVPRQDGLDCAWEYDTDLFEAEWIEQLSSLLQGMLDGMNAVRDQPLSQVSLVDDEARAQLETWNDTARAYDLTVGISQRVQEQAARTPEALALVFGEERLTYRDFNARVNAVAWQLMGRGVGRGDRVAVVMPRSASRVVALHAVMRAGAAFVPIDPTYPEARVAFMLEDCRPSLVLTEIESLQTHARHENPPAQAGPDDLAYILYTSGSTGRPKGAMNAHRGITNRLLWMQEALPLGAADRVLQKTPFSFDVSVWEFFWPLMTGATLVVARPGGHRDPGYLSQVIQAEQITTVHFVPSMLSAWLEGGEVEACTSLRQIVSSGEVLGAAARSELLARTGATLHNLYGPTEAAVDVTWWRCDAADRGESPIGRPIANTSIQVLDRTGALCPVGVPGELHIGGVQVGLGYWDRPELTETQFVPDPFVGGSARMYRTGDRARWRADGVLEFLGRLDHQVKLRGQRIEPGEIEAALELHSGVTRASVVLRELPGRGETLVAYCVGEAQESALRQSLEASLPAHMLPGAFVWLETLPLTPSGKLDRRSLPAPRFEAAAGEAPHAGAEAEMEALWCEVLGVPEVHREGHFFELGGHSLLVVQLLARLRQTGAEVRFQAIFEAPTLAGFTERVTAARRVETPGPSPRSEARAPLSLTQLGLLDVRGVDPAQTADTVPGGWWLHGPLDAEVLTWALVQLLERHEGLRSALEEDSSGLWMVPRSAWPVLEVVSLEDTAPEGREAEATRRGALDALHAFDLHEGRMLKAHLYVLDPERHYLVMNVHHICSDGWSIAVLVRELSEFYQARLLGQTAVLPPVLSQGDATTWSRQRWAGGLDPTREAYWRSKLADHAPLRWHSPVPTEAGDACEIWSCQTTVGVEPLQSLARARGTTLFVLGVTALCAALRERVQGPRFCLGTFTAARDRVELEGVVGYLTQGVPLCISLPETATWTTLLEHAAHVVEEGLEHTAPLSLIEALCDSPAPLSEIVVVHQGFEQAPLSLPGVTARALHLNRGVARRDLSVRFFAQGDALEVVWEYRCERFDHGYIEALAASFDEALSALLEAPERRVW